MVGNPGVGETPTVLDELIPLTPTGTQMVFTFFSTLYKRGAVIMTTPRFPYSIHVMLWQILFYGPNTNSK